MFYIHQYQSTNCKGMLLCNFETTMAFNKVSPSEQAPKDAFYDIKVKMWNMYLLKAVY